MIIEGQEYITGQFRGDGGENMVSHLYKGTFSDPGFPMCSRGWQRKWYYKNGKIKDYEYSIFRNNISMVCAFYGFFVFSFLVSILTGEFDPWTKKNIDPYIINLKNWLNRRNE